MVDPVDFIPEDCFANAIASCIDAKECKQKAFNVPSFSGSDASFSLGLDEVKGLVTILTDDYDSCILAALAIAFVNAGVAMPSIPPPPPEPDFTKMLEDMEQMGADAADPLGYVSDQFTITYNSLGIPVRIQT